MWAADSNSPQAVYRWLDLRHSHTIETDGRSRMRILFYKRLRNVHISPSNCSSNAYGHNMSTLTVLDGSVHLLTKSGIFEIRTSLIVIVAASLSHLPTASDDFVHVAIHPAWSATDTSRSNLHAGACHVILVSAKSRRHPAVNSKWVSELFYVPLNI